MWTSEKSKFAIAVSVSVRDLFVKFTCERGSCSDRPQRRSAEKKLIKLNKIIDKEEDKKRKKKRGEETELL